MSRCRFQVLLVARWALPAFLAAVAACHADEPGGTGDLACADGEVPDGEGADATCVPEACGAAPFGVYAGAERTLFVSPDGSDAGDGSEGDPMAGVQAALDAAAEADLDQVVLAAGTYLENVVFPDDHGALGLRGRCRELVTLDGGGDTDMATLGVVVQDRAPVADLSGLTITGGKGGVWVDSAEVSISDVEVRDNTWVGILVRYGAEVSLASVSVTGTLDLRGQYGYGVVVQEAALTAADLTATANTGMGVVSVDSSTVTLEDCVVSDTTQGEEVFGYGVAVLNGAGATLERCALDGNGSAGLAVDGAGSRLDATDILVTGTLANELGVSRGLTASNGAALTCTRCEVTGGAEVGASADGDGASIELVDSVVADTALATGNGRGASAVHGSTLSLTRTAVTGNASMGVYAGDVGTVVTLVDSEVSGTLEDSEGYVTGGVVSSDGASLSASGCVVEGNADFGALVIDEGSSLTLEDSSVTGTLTPADGTFGAGVHVDIGANATLRRVDVAGNANAGLSVVGGAMSSEDCAITDTRTGPAGIGYGLWASDGGGYADSGSTFSANRVLGMFADGAGTTVDLQGTQVLATEPAEDGLFGRGLDVETGAVLTAASCTIDGNSEEAVFVSGEGSVVSLEDSSLNGTLAPPENHLGCGILVHNAGTVTAARCSIDGSVYVGAVAIEAGSVLTLTDSTVTGTASDPTGAGGYGVGALDGASVTLDGGSSERNTELGVGASGQGTTVTITDYAVRDTVRGRGMAIALGVSAQEGALIDASGLAVSGTDGPGLHLVDDAELLCEDCTISSNSFAGALADGGELVLSGCEIDNTGPDEELGGGFGVYALGATYAPVLTIQDSEIGPHLYGAVWLDGPGSYWVEGNLLSGSSGYAGRAGPMHGNAVFAERGVAAWDGAQGLELVGNAFVDAPNVAVLLDASGATMSGNSWSGNGLDLLQQSCDGVPELTEGDVEGVPLASICPSTNTATAFDLAYTGLYLPPVTTE